MKKLSEKEYWDSIYENYKVKEITLPFLGKFKSWLKNASRDYSNYLIWEVLYPKYLPKSSHTKVIEIGCAPGSHIIGLHERFGYIPYGVEYSEAGCDLSRKNFVSHGLPPQNIIQSDFLDKTFQSEHANIYDIVVSLGFIEHFDDAKKVVDQHVGLIKDKGYLIVLIPNLSGLNYYSLKFLNSESLLGHNLSIMNKTKFQSLFKNDNLETLYCDYIGLFSFGLFNTDSKWKYYMWRILLILQRPFDFIQRFILKGNSIKNKYSSPYLMYIGRKK